MKNLYTIFYLTILLLSSSSIIAQYSSELKLVQLTNELKKYNFSLDSLNALLEQRVNIINSEKLKNNKDNERITNLLSSTASITNKIDATQNNIGNINNDIAEIKSELFSLYSAKIDSIKSTNSESNSSNIEIIKLTEKRLLVSPMIDMLSFPPQNVLDIKVAKDETEQMIYKEYLTEAQQEVDDKLTEINKLRDEIENIIELNEETEEFIEEVGFDNNFAVYSNPTSGNRTSSVESSSDYGDELKRNTLDTQAKSFGDILFQFGTSNNLISDIQINPNENSGTTNLRDFRKLIQIVEKQLHDYNTVIENKLRTINIK